MYLLFSRFLVLYCTTLLCSWTRQYFLNFLKPSICTGSNNYVGFLAFCVSLWEQSFFSHTRLDPVTLRQSVWFICSYHYQNDIRSCSAFILFENTSQAIRQNCFPVLSSLFFRFATWFLRRPSNPAYFQHSDTPLRIQFLVLILRFVGQVYDLKIRCTIGFLFNLLGPKIILKMFAKELSRCFCCLDWESVIKR